MWKTRYGTYDHLARVKEWSVGGDDEEGGTGGAKSAASRPRIIPDVVLQRQTAASDPDVSAWVAANAGSGKTHVLALRVIRLLLADVAPAKILCITFTKAAAANMAKRVFDTLGRWIALDDAALDEAIRTISNLKPSPALRARARRLFALALETPGGLKVQTIHAFCTRLLHQFPFEAEVAAGFEVLDGAAETLLLHQVNLGVLLDVRPMSPHTARPCARDRDRHGGRPHAQGGDRRGDPQARPLVETWIAHGGSIEGAVAGLCGMLDVSPTTRSSASRTRWSMVRTCRRMSGTTTPRCSTLARTSDRERAGLARRGAPPVSARCPLPPHLPHGPRRAAQAHLTGAIEKTIRRWRRA